MQVLAHHALGHEQLLGEPAEHVQQVLAQALAPAQALAAAPHGAESAQNTASPGATLVTPSPTDSTMPANSWPSRAG